MDQYCSAVRLPGAVGRHGLRGEVRDVRDRLELVFAVFRGGRRIEGRAPFEMPTTAGALPPLPDAPWQLAHCSPYSFCPSAT